MKRCIMAHSSQKLGTAAFNEILSQLEQDGKSIEPVLVIFASDCNNFGWYSRMLADCYKSALVIGMTSHMMYSGDSSSHTGLAVLAVTEGITVSGGVLQEASRFPRHFAAAIEDAYREIGTDENTVCLEFNASEDPCEEIVMDTFEEVIGKTRIKLCGGTAAKGENPVRPSAVSLNGVVYKDAAVFSFIHNENGVVDVIKESIFSPTNASFTATDVDCSLRKVYEFDHIPAANAVANALKISPDEVAKQGFFHPLGKMNGDDLDIVSVDSVYDDGSMSFFTLVYNQTKVNLLNTDDSIQDDWDDTARKVHESVENPSFVIAISCFLRTKHFLELGINDEFTAKLNSEYKNYIGFSAFGEQMCYKHLNQTMILLVFE